MGLRIRDKIILDTMVRAAKAAVKGEVFNPEDFLKQKLAEQESQLRHTLPASLKQEKGLWVGEVSFLVASVPAPDRDRALDSFRKFVANELRNQDSPVRDVFFEKAIVYDGEKPKDPFTSRRRVTARHTSPMTKNDKLWDVAIAMRVTGIPGKNKNDALENFRKYIGNQLRSESSDVRKRFLQLATLKERTC